MAPLLHSSSDDGRHRLPPGLGDVRHPVHGGEHDKTQRKQCQRHLVQGAPRRTAVQYDVFGDQLESQLPGGRDHRWTVRRHRLLQLCRWKLSFWSLRRHNEDKHRKSRNVIIIIIIVIIV